MQKSIFYIFLIYTTLFSSCLNKNDTNDKETSKCIIQNAENLNQLLTDGALEVLSYKAHLGEKEEFYNQLSEYNLLQYSWESKRNKTLSIMDKKVFMKPKDIISISGIKKTTEQEFIKKYQTIFELGNSFRAESIPHIGDIAFWNKSENKLQVFIQGVQFTLRIDINNDSKINRDKSIELGNLIINNCK